MTERHIDQTLREQQKSQKGSLIWITGLSAAGKSTIAKKLEDALYQRGHHTYLLDGDKVRTGLNKDLDFTMHSREENIRRLGEVSRLLVDAGLIVICAAISPLRASREQVRALFDASSYTEVYLSTPLEVCEKRDPKSLYQQARAGKIAEFTGIASPYEAPLNPEISMDTSSQNVEVCVLTILAFLQKHRGVHP